MDGGDPLRVQLAEQSLHGPHYPVELLQLLNIVPGEGDAPLHLKTKVHEGVVRMISMNI